MHVEEDVQPSIEKGVRVNSVREIEFKLRSGSKSLRYGGQAWPRSYRFRFNLAAWAQVQLEGTPT